MKDHLQPHYLLNHRAIKDKQPVIREFLEILGIKLKRVAIQHAVFINHDAAPWTVNCLGKAVAALVEEIMEHFFTVNLAFEGNQDVTVYIIVQLFNP